MGGKAVVLNKDLENNLLLTGGEDHGLGRRADGNLAIGDDADFNLERPRQRERGSQDETQIVTRLHDDSAERFNRDYRSGHADYPYSRAFVLVHGVFLCRDNFTLHPAIELKLLVPNRNIRNFKRGFAAGGHAHGYEFFPVDRFTTVGEPDPNIQVFNQGAC